jgi:transcriptional regulator with XRE-family HTH domain
MITPEQIRAARALLRIEQGQLARRAHLSIATVKRIEAENGAARVAEATVERIRQVLEAEGAEFIADGVRRRRRPAYDAELRYRELRAIAERSAAQRAGLPPFSEEDLYDGQGLPS